MKPTVAIITGGSRGIGAEIVRRLASSEHHVSLVYSNNDAEAFETAQRCATATTQVVPFKCDITAPNAPQRIFEEAERLGTPVVLINNAGLTGKISSLAESTETEIRQAIEINLTATIMLCRQAIQHWLDQDDGYFRSIVNLSSIAAKTGAPNEYVWYAAAKAGVNALTTGLALEAAHHSIRVNAVSPGTTTTTIHAKAGRPNRAAEVGARSPMGRPATPDEIAAAVEWLVGPEASYVNGAILDVTGGTR